MAREITVRLVRQPPKKPWCGPACAKMVLAHHRIHKALPTIARELPLNKWGIRIGDLGTYLLSQELEVNLHFWVQGMQPRLMGIRDQDVVKKALALPLTGRAGTNDRRAWAVITNSILRFSRAGGNVVLEPTHQHHIETALGRSCPPIVSLNPWLLREEGTTDEGHYVVPTRMSPRDSQVSRPMITYLDPLEREESTKYVEEFMHACHLWQGAALFIAPKGSAALHAHW